MPGRPSGARTWRTQVAEAAAGLRLGNAIALDFVLPPAKWVDLDTLIETAAQGLRDAGALAPRYSGLDGIVATKRFGQATGVTISTAPAEGLAAPPPGPAEVAISDDAVPRAGNTTAKRQWRDTIAAAWSREGVLAGDLWADVRLRIGGSLLGPLEVVLDALEPVLGRDPRGRDWQEFFPNDDRIVWLRVSRVTTGRAVALEIGSLGT